MRDLLTFIMIIGLIWVNAVLCVQSAKLLGEAIVRTEKEQAEEAQKKDMENFDRWAASRNK